jgi:hypothetical protein
MRPGSRFSIYGRGPHGSHLYKERKGGPARPLPTSGSNRYSLLIAAFCIPLSLLSGLGCRGQRLLSRVRQSEILKHGDILFKRSEIVGEVPAVGRNTCDKRPALTERDLPQALELPV